jgi:hypothetical protein
MLRSQSHCLFKVEKWPFPDKLTPGNGRQYLNSSVQRVSGARKQGVVKFLGWCSQRCPGWLLPCTRDGVCRRFTLKERIIMNHYKWYKCSKSASTLSIACSPKYVNLATFYGKKPFAYPSKEIAFYSTTKGPFHVLYIYTNTSRSNALIL